MELQRIEVLRMCRMICLPQFWTGLFEIKQVQCILLVLFHPVSIGREEYFQVTGMNDARKQREFLRKKEGPEVTQFNEIQTQTPSYKTTSLGTLLEYAQYSSHHYQTIYAHHKKLRKLSFTQKVRWGIGMGVVINKLCQGNVLRPELSHVHRCMVWRRQSFKESQRKKDGSNAEILETSATPSMGEGSSHGQRMGHFQDLLRIKVAHLLFEFVVY
ncbi:hypothetical protein BJ741DRAFT_648630 [Chytriomyces cf. hyalinus JEL632]|nr:hypothetical protein BJ741DRAFT_648630 [Chytriomyces cf. hyalinus JEL632]